MYKILIDSCLYCTHLEKEFYCRHPEIGFKKVDPKLGYIPIWCPLEVYNKEVGIRKLIKKLT